MDEHCEKWTNHNADVEFFLYLFFTQSSKLYKIPDSVRPNIRPGKSNKMSSREKFRALKQRNANQRRIWYISMKCWCGMIESSPLGCPSSIHSPTPWILNDQYTILHNPTLNFIYPNSFSIFNTSILSQNYGILTSSDPAQTPTQLGA